MFFKISKQTESNYPYHKQMANGAYFNCDLGKKPLDSVRMLRGRWERLTVSADWLLGVVADLAAALAYTHAHQVSHGDVYAHNVLVDFAQATGARPTSGHVATLYDYGAGELGGGKGREGGAGGADPPPP